MNVTEIERLEAHVLQGNSGCTLCQGVSQLTAHTRDLQRFVTDLAAHHATPGPTPEKLAEHYQLVDRAKALRALIDAPSTPAA